MTTLTITLIDDLNTFVESQVSGGGHASAGDYLLSLVREAQRRQAKTELEAKLLEGLASGPSTPLTREGWDSIEREALERVAREAIRP